LGPRNHELIRPRWGLGFLDQQTEALLRGHSGTFPAVDILKVTHKGHHAVMRPAYRGKIFTNE